MELRLAASLAVALVLGALVTVEIGAGNERTRAAGSRPREELAAAPRSSVQEDERAVDELACPSLAWGRKPLEALDGSSDAPAQVQADGTRRMRIALRLPENLPAGDRPALVVLTRRRGGELGGIRSRHLASEVRTSQPLERSVAPFIAWTQRAARNGAVEIQVGGGAEEALVLLRSRHLYLDPAEVDLRAEAELELAPKLGGYVAGRCLLPRESRLDGADGTDVEVDLVGQLPDGRTDRRHMECAANGSFELWGLAPEVHYRVVARAPSLPSVTAAFQVEAGRRRRLEILFGPGAVARGVVVDGDGQPVAGVHVALAGKENDWFTRGESDELGRFELVGVPTGEFELVASAPGRRGTVVLTARNGQILNGVCLQLTSQPTERVSGRCGLAGERD